MTKIKSFSDSKRELKIQFPRLKRQLELQPEALQLQGGRDQKTSTVGESETKVLKTFDTLKQSKTKSKVFKHFKSIGSG